MPQSLQSFREGSLPCLTKVDKAKALLQKGHYEAALQYFRQAEMLETPSADNSVWQSICLIHMGRFQVALDLCDRALTLDGDHPQAWLFRGVACQRLGRWREAYACYDNATGRQPGGQAGLVVQAKGWLRTLKASIKGIFNSRHSRLRVH
ncbi:MAG: tetratricopeptide repeat protein [Cyanobacteria bacterium J06626_18]